MSKVQGNKAKGRQSARGAKYYETQFHRTTANKLRREKARIRKAKSPGAIRRKAARLAKQKPRS